MHTKESGKTKMFKGILLLLWEELKTMNVTKIKSLYRIGAGYIRMKYSARKKLQHKKQQSDFESSYRLSG